MLNCYNQVYMPLTLLLLDYEANSRILLINPLIKYPQTLPNLALTAIVAIVLKEHVAWSEPCGSRIKIYLENVQCMHKVSKDF